ncbi:hypothetical protein [Arthrobacter sp. zg-Y1171]|uniref:hypothetical protein n=1 Tax=Arthrobacter sp. zg-Y1171 TaxID=2964610 RepID=UPI00210816F9|nr:hypothetical protein [Arthrobacter sp. zg-Y1171]MCQ1996489.1 hypothetical protein [Arthrobacter sp. zg-Y1171]UWX82091.1 hypothetical protein N2L00_01215 [Arthrobacter sp. zg-Y1171]
MTLPDPLQGIPALPSGDDFEAFVWSLLQRRYPPEKLRYFPAEMGGDKGLEGFSTDGIAYQCYADKDSLDLRARTQKQRAKLNRDTLKLQKNKDDLPQLLDGLIIQNYFLIVPQYHSTELVAYANKRAATVRSWGLSFISTDFSITLKTPQDYQGEYQAALSDAAVQVRLPEPVVSDGAVSGFAGTQPMLTTTLLRKLQDLKNHHPAADIQTMRKSLTKWFLAKEEMMENLRDFPQTREAIEAQRRLQQEALEFENGFAVTQPHDRVLKVVDDYANQLESVVAGLRKGDAQRLSRGQAGEWLMRCPLEFQALP